MSRLIVVSNRVPSVTSGKVTGGLVVALKAALEENGGLWFGWSGELPAVPKSEPTLASVGAFSLATIDLSPEDFEGYYTQHANRALWPLLHGRVDLSLFDPEHYRAYRRVNLQFASALGSLIRDGDMIWIHDYHLIPLAAELRRRGVSAPIGFFLHTPFPSPDTIACLPPYREMLTELASYDLVGFQTSNCLQNYRDAMDRHLRASIVQNAITVNGHSSLAGCYPIGIDTAGFSELARSETVRQISGRLKKCMGDEGWVVGVERLDYTKGLVERFEAFEALLENENKLRGKLSLVQIAAPSRESVSEYREMQSRLEAISGRINGRHGDFDWTPIRYLNRSFSQPQLAALYRLSKIGLVTPLRDGMNLVAKEYVAAQDPEDPGVLVLSRFAGAAEELTSALIVNPYDRSGVAAALKRALEIPLEERRARWRKMMQHLLRTDVYRWSRNFVRDLSFVEGEPAMPDVAARIGPSYARLPGRADAPRPAMGASSETAAFGDDEDKVKTA